VSNSRLAGALAVALVLAGCGFQPLYGEREGTAPLTAALNGVAVDQQKTRVGQLIRNEFLADVPPGQGGVSAWRLELEPEAREVNEIEAHDTDVLRKTYRLNVTFRLTDNRTGKPVYSGKTFSYVSYDRVTSPLANVQAATNAQERAAREVGTDIRTRIAAYLASL
jgi:LPS-assembly lipoprotein